MDPQSRRVLELVEELLELFDTVAILAAIERAMKAVYGSSARLVLDLTAPPTAPHLALDYANVALGYVVSDQLQELPVDRFFRRVAGWGLSCALPARALQDRDWLRVARLVVEEGLPQTSLRHGQWEAFGALQPAFHVGGDCFSYLVNDDILCFLLLDAVGHGVGSALLATSCRSLWRGVVFEKDLAVTVSRLNQRLFEDIGSERFVAATLGFCHQDGHIEFVCCGQSPAYLVQPQGVELLTECDPPLGLFFEWDFQVQHVQLGSQSGLFFSTDGALECRVEGNMFGESGMTGALAGAPAGPTGTVQRVLDALADFCGSTVPSDDVCCLCIWHHP